MSVKGAKNIPTSYSKTLQLIYGCVMTQFYQYIKCRLKNIHRNKSPVHRANAICGIITVEQSPLNVNIVYRKDV